MGSSLSSKNRHQDNNHEQFHFRFTDCSCKCDANKQRIEDIYKQSDIPQAALLAAFMTRTNGSEYDINCDCQCGEGVKMGFVFGNTSSNSQQKEIK